MNVKINAELSEDEFYNLYCVIGEFKRITRDQYYRFIGTGYAYSDSLHNKEIYDKKDRPIIHKEFVKEYHY